MTESPVHATPATHRRRPLPPNYIGADPYDIVGKILTRARKSAHHPSVILEFSDNTSFQILLDGYDPVHPGIPKELEMDSELQAFFTSGQLLDLPIIGCTFTTFQDWAFESKAAHEVRWEQKHFGIAFKFAEERPRWRCIWATMEERDTTGACIFRNYSDVYLEKARRPKLHTGRDKRKQRRQSGSW
ncbi:hypothetical protein H0H81_009174 [Sphagnurus paluster]|uniref:Uncharacterized protein n=1 Tax=Sphagnurus paluster TaxID=117069 RepID=A0A9P7FXA4_9AGAR|nr:hypothetical protein H0H81_009174 [Sphagnurus paluster]